MIPSRLSILTKKIKSTTERNACFFCAQCNRNCSIAKADFSSTNVLIYPAIATGNVEIAATGRVSGNIKTDLLVISKGGCFRGNVAKINEEPAAPQRPLYLIEEKLAGQNGPR